MDGGFWAKKIPLAGGMVKLTGKKSFYLSTHNTQMAVRVIDPGQFWWGRTKKIPPERDSIIYLVESYWLEY